MKRFSGLVGCAICLLIRASLIHAYGLPAHDERTHSIFYSRAARSRPPGAGHNFARSI